MGLFLLEEAHEGDHILHMEGKFMWRECSATTYKDGAVREGPSSRAYIDGRLFVAPGALVARPLWTFLNAPPAGKKANVEIKLRKGRPAVIVKEGNIQKEEELLLEYQFHPLKDHECEVCKLKTQWDRMILCDGCDRGDHTTRPIRWSPVFIF